VARYREQLAGAQLSVVSAAPDPELDAAARTIAGSVRVSGRRALARLFGELLAAQHGQQVVPKTLDLYGHSTARTAQLVLGDWVIDASSPRDQVFFRALAKRAVLARLGITGVRLLACRTAGTEAGRATIDRLADALGVEVWGARDLLYDAHHDARGFLAAWQFLLVSASELRRAALPAATHTAATHTAATHTAAPHTAATEPPTSPRWRAPPAATAQILALLHHAAGAPMLGRAAAPSCELVLSASPHGRVARVLHDGAFLELYPDGPSAPGVAYPVKDPAALGRIIASLAPAD
jgi:hypothetical protein